MVSGRCATLPTRSTPDSRNLFLASVVRCKPGGDTADWWAKHSDVEQVLLVLSLSALALVSICFGTVTSAVQVLLLISQTLQEAVQQPKAV